MARLTPENTQRAREVIALYPQPRSALIPVLHIAQEQDGYLTGEAMTHIGELIGLNPAEVRGTATFYDMLFLEPIGKYLLSVCTNIACLLNGAYELLEHIEHSLGVKAGGTTPDGVFTVEEVECIALCGNAPCLTANWRYFGDVTPASFDALVDDLRMGRLADVVPAHGTLCKARRAVGLPAAGFTGPAPAAPAPAAAAARRSGLRRPGRRRPGRGPGPGLRPAPRRRRGRPQRPHPQGTYGFQRRPRHPSAGAQRARPACRPSPRLRSPGRHAGSGPAPGPAAQAIMTVTDAPKIVTRHLEHPRELDAEGIHRTPTATRACARP